VSVLPPTANGTTYVIALLGQSPCATADDEIAPSAANARAPIDAPIHFLDMRISLVETLTCKCRAKEYTTTATDFAPTPLVPTVSARHNENSAAVQREDAMFEAV
jgi:hypothetical protein